MVLPSVRIVVTSAGADVDVVEGLVAAVLLLDLHQ